jgi:hypothetical protein
LLLRSHALPDPEPKLRKRKRSCKLDVRQIRVKHHHRVCIGHRWHRSHRRVVLPRGLHPRDRLYRRIRPDIPDYQPLRRRRTIYIFCRRCSSIDSAELLCLCLGLPRHWAISSRPIRRVMGFRGGRRDTYVDSDHLWGTLHKSRVGRSLDDFGKY